MLETMGVSRVVYFDVHAPATQGFFDVPVDPLSALLVLADYFNGPSSRTPLSSHRMSGARSLPGCYAEYLKLPLVVMHKRRESFEHAQVSHVVGDIRDKIPIIIDDVIAGGSVLDEIDVLIDAGARPEVYLAITHGVLLESALKRLDHPFIKKLIVSDTIQQPPEILSHPKVEVVSVAPLLADAIWRIHVGSSISSLIDKARG